jgi:hypothetical protein
MRDHLFIGSTPADEDCAQVGQPNYRREALAECRAFIEAIKKKLGPPPENAELAIKACPHDFGTYHEVVCYYEDTDRKSLDYALKCESDAPATWAEVGWTREQVLKGDIHENDSTVRS